MSKALDRLDGALIGLRDLQEQLNKVREKENGYFVVSSTWVSDFIEHNIQIYDRIKIKRLEEELIELTKTVVK